MKCKRRYKDKEKFRQYRNGYNSRYYKKTENAIRKRLKWTDKEIEMILGKKHTDTELSNMIGRSVKAIQVKRSKLNAQWE